MNGYGYGHKIRPERDPDAEWVAPPPADFMLSPLATPMGTTTQRGLVNCRTCSARVACNEAVRKFGYFADMECEAAQVSRSSVGSGRRPTSDAEKLRQEIARVVAEHPEGVRAAEVADAVGATRTTVISALGRMEALGLVQVRAVARRRNVYFATRETRSLIP